MSVQTHIHLSLHNMCMHAPASMSVHMVLHRSIHKSIHISFDMSLDMWRVPFGTCCQSPRILLGTYTCCQPPRMVLHTLPPQFELHYRALHPPSAAARTRPANANINTPAISAIAIALSIQTPCGHIDNVDAIIVDISFIDAAFTWRGSRSSGGG